MLNDTEKQIIREAYYAMANKKAYGACFEYCDFKKIYEETADYWLSILDKTIKYKLEAVEKEVMKAMKEDEVKIDGIKFYAFESKDIINKTQDIFNKHKGELTEQKHLMIKCEKCDQILLNVGNLDCEVTELRYGGHAECKFNNKHK